MTETPEAEPSTAPFHTFLAAVGFLTRIPVRPPLVVMAKAAPWFPVVGLLIGLVQGAAYLGLRELLPPLPAAVVAIAAGVLLTGAFHHDGLADMADALGGGWTVEQRMAILKDSRLGTYGTAALVLALAAEISAVSSLEPLDGFRALVAAHALSRAVAVVVMYRAPLAGDGLGASYAAGLSWSGTVAALVVGVAATAVAFGGRWVGIVPVAALAVAFAIVAAVTVVALAVSKIGGITGDVLGAVQQLAALAVLLVAVAAQ